MADYNIFKDDIPQNTIKKIKKILKDFGIEVEEVVTSITDQKNKFCPSIRINVSNTSIGTNGKGSSIENCYASGYGEFMERLQNLDLFVTDIPDERIVNIKNINKSVFCTKKLNFEFEKVNTVPFYSLKDRTVIDIPLYLFETTTGQAAGNSFEEAFVQGLSEICERFAMKCIVKNKLSLPIIPQCEYMKYDKLREIINFYNKNGYEIFIKDASIGKKLPVVCAVAINRKENILSFSFGAHPSLPISIERSLTELFQGRNINDVKLEKNYVTNDYYNKYFKANPTALCEKLCISPLIFENNDDLTKQFLSNDSYFEFNHDAWIDLSKKNSNKDLLKFLIKNINHITKNNIYVRDVSFLGFPSISIFIPKMSNFIHINPSQYSQINKWKHYKGQKDVFYNDIVSFYNLAEFISIHPLLTNSLSDKYPVEYILLLCSILLKNYSKIHEYANILIDKYEIKKDNLIKIIREYYGYIAENFSEEDIKIKLASKFSYSEIELFYKFIDNLSFSVIKYLLISTEKGDIAKTSEISRKLQKIYKENIPNQMNLKKIFYDIF